MKNALTLLIGAAFAFTGLTGCCNMGKKNCSTSAETCPATGTSCPAKKKTSCCPGGAAKTDGNPNQSASTSN